MQTVLSPGPRRIFERRSAADRVFRSASTGAGLLTLVILTLIGLFLLLRAAPAFRETGLSFLTTQAWGPDRVNHKFGIAALLYWTVAIAAIAMVIAVPVSIAIALFITQYAPTRLRRGLIALVDLLAAVPSVIYGVWGLLFLMTQMVDVSRWLSENLGFIPIFAGDGTNFANSAFIVGIVLSLMVIPISTSVMREVFAQTPPGEKEAALALGATRWAMIRTVVLPFGRGGIIGGSMLGLGRALGETIAVALLISPVLVISGHILHSGANSVAATIALQFPEATLQRGIPALMAAGVSLFVLTLVVNFGASLIVRRSRSGKGVEI
jgi:phosphate transport system permease protein